MMLTQNDWSAGGLRRCTSIPSPFFSEYARIFRKVPSVISTMAGISTRVSVQTIEMGFLRFSTGSERTISKMRAATRVLSFPPLNPTNHGRSSSVYRCWSLLLMSLYAVASISDNSRVPCQNGLIPPPQPPDKSREDSTKSLACFLSQGNNLPTKPRVLHQRAKGGNGSMGAGVAHPACFAHGQRAGVGVVPVGIDQFGRGQHWLGVAL